MLTYMDYLFVYLVSVPAFFLIDMAWLGIVARGIYRTQLGSLLAPSVNWPVAICFYLLFLVGLMVFAIAPAIEAKDILHAILYGALFGFFAYATYDLTNWSTLRDWPAMISLIDMAWGTFLAASVSGITAWVALTFIIR